MSYLGVKHTPDIEECFKNWGKIQSHRTEAEWEVASNNGAAFSVHAHLLEDWLQIHADTGTKAGNAQILSALKWNGGLDGAARFSFSLQDRSMDIRAEIPLDSEVNITSDLMATLTGFGLAGELVHDFAGMESRSKLKSAGKRPTRDSPLPLRQLLTEADWPFTERSEGSCMVELDTRDDFQQALIETRSDGSRRASVELAEWENPEPAPLNALAVLLLTASDVIRMVRPVVEDFGNRIVARFEACFSPNAGPALLDRGLASLSVACRHCSREAAVLNNPRIAEEYLAVRHINIE